MEDETRETVTTGTGNPCGCCGEAHPECDCGEHIAVDPCLPVENTKTKVVQHADNVEQACRVCHADNVGTLYEGIQSLEAGRLIRIDGTNRINVTLTAGDGIAIDEDTGKISSTMRSLEAGRLTKITQDGKVSSTLQAGKNVSIDEQTGLISAESGLSGGDLTEISDDGKINCILEAGRLMEIDANRMACKVQGGDLIAIDESTGTVDCTLTAGRLMTLEGNIISSKVAAGTNISVDETTGTVSCSLTGGRLTEIDDSGRVSSTLQAGNLMEITEDGTMNVTLTAGDGITIEDDNIKAPNGYGLRYSNNKLSLYALSGKGIKNKSEGSQNLGGFAYMPELDIEGGQGITIGNNGNTVTISTATPLDRDYLFDQADSVRGNDTDIFYLYKSRANNANNIKILDAAQAMPDHALVDLTGSEASFWLNGSEKYLLGRQFEDSDDTFSLVDFHAEEIGTQRFLIRINLSKYMPSVLATKVDRVIAAASPLWLANGIVSSDADERLYEWKYCFGGFFQCRKAVQIPEETAFLVYRNYLDTTRLHDRLSAYSGARTAHSETLYQFLEERDVYTNFNAYRYFMGRTYSEMSEFDPNFYAMSGNFHLDNNYTYEDIWIDSFFGCFPGYVVECMYLENNNLVVTMKSFHNSLKTYQIPVPRMRIFFPKNEIIRKVRQMLADGEIDEYGNSLTQSTSEQPDDTQTEAAQQADNSETTINTTDDGNTDEQ